MSAVTEPGIYTLPPEDYHADPCPEPSLSCSIAKLLVRQSPRHAFHNHPRLGGGDGLIPTRAMDAGSVVHALVLGIGAPIVEVQATYGPKHKRAGLPVSDFKTDAAESERDAIREAGGIPVLKHKLPEYRACAEAAAQQMRQIHECADFFGPGQSEAVIVWREFDCWFRAMVDRLPDHPRASPYDVKATEMSAAPGKWERRMRDEYAFQAAFYERGLRILRGAAPGPMRFIPVELSAPYGTACLSSSPKLQMLADAEVDRAIRAWVQCLRANEWPCYSHHVAYVEPPNWMFAEEEARQLRDEMEEDENV